MRIQVLDLDHDRRVWPTQRTAILNRYADAPQISLTVPTPDAFTAMKILAFLDRAAPRDLADLAALADAGAIRREGLALVRKAAGWTPTPAMFARLPRAVAEAWRADLAHQLSELPDPEVCLRKVRAALQTA